MDEETKDRLDYLLFYLLDEVAMFIDCKEEKE